MNRTVSIEGLEMIMLDFASSTGLEPVSQTPRRYLWTDAFAVCNFLELFRQTNDKRYLDLAERLVDQVHHTLGRHRPDDLRGGWISGLEEEEGEEHPTVGGLRIGKEHNERKPEEPVDPFLEWEQDGQYYHYLTRWMHALERAGAVTGEGKYLRWAVELAKRAESSFVYDIPSSGRKRMYWKMSIDLSHPQVASMGQHDPLDGFVTYSELQWASKGRSQEDLRSEISEISQVCRAGDWATDDALGIGGLLFDASRVGQLMVHGHDLEALLERILRSSAQSLRYFSAGSSLELSANQRLAFRELGLAIGLKAITYLTRFNKEEGSIFSGRESIRQQVEEIEGWTALADQIEDFWTDPRNQKAETWVDHREINMVMLVTSLIPYEFLSI